MTSLRYRGPLLWLWELKLSLAIKQWNGIATGISTLTQDGYHILTIDWDNAPLETIRYEMKAIQRRHTLGTIYILESSPGKYHTITFDKIEHQEQQRLLQQVHCDPAYRETGITILRTGKKGEKPAPIYKEAIVPDVMPPRKTSRAHINHYLSVIPTMKEATPIQYDLDRADTSTTILKITYTT